MAEDNFAMGYALGQDSGNGCNNGGMFGNEGWWAIILFAMIFGWGRGGWGGYGDGGGSTAPCNCATQADVRAAVDQQTLISKLDQQTYGLADSTYALNNTIVNGFHGVDNAVCNLGYNVQSGFNTIAHQISDCCCATQRAIDGVNYNMATQLCALGNTVTGVGRDIIDNQNANTRAILDFMTQDKIATLTAENQNLKFAASQTAQNQFITQVGSDIVNRLQPPPVPSYTVPNPYSGYGYTGCGCCA